MLMNMTSLLCTTLFLCRALDSSVGRAVDCSCDHQTSIGRWFKSGSREFFVLSIGGVKVGSTLHGGQISIPR